MNRTLIRPAFFEKYLLKSEYKSLARSLVKFFRIYIFDFRILRNTHYINIKKINHPLDYYLYKPPI